MKHNVLAPSVGESITEVSILKWSKPSGSQVQKGELLLEIESDKATVEVVAEATGQLQIVKNAGERIPIGETIGLIDDAATGTTVVAAAPAPRASTPAPQPTMAASAGSGPSGASAYAFSGAEVNGPSVRKILHETGVNPAEISGTG